ITNLPNVWDVTVNFKELALKEINKLGDKSPARSASGATQIMQASTRASDIGGYFVRRHDQSPSAGPSGDDAPKVRRRRTLGRDHVPTHWQRMSLDLALNVVSLQRRDMSGVGGQADS